MIVIEFLNLDRSNIEIYPIYFHLKCCIERQCLIITITGRRVAFRAYLEYRESFVPEET
jgi:hypothetical protein